MKRLLLLGDGKGVVGQSTSPPRACTPTLAREQRGPVHELLDRGLRELARATDFEWVHPLPLAERMGGFRTSWHGWISALEGRATSPRLQGRPYLGGYLASQSHAIDVVVFAHDTEAEGNAAEIVAAVSSAARASNPNRASIAAIEVGAMVPCVEAWLLARAFAPCACAPLKAELAQQGVVDPASRLARARAIDVQRLRDDVPEFRDLVDRIARHL